MSHNKFIESMKKSAEKHGVNLTVVQSDCPHSKIIKSDLKGAKNIKKQIK